MSKNSEQQKCFIHPTQSHSRNEICFGMMLLGLGLERGHIHHIHAKLVF
jgi:hypothetical protein